MSEKITGYLLLIAGLSLMIFSTWQVFMLMTNTKTSSLLPGGSSTAQEEQQAPPPSLSNLRNIPLPSAGSDTPTVNPLSMLQSIPNLDSLMSSVITYFLMGFLLNLGYKLCSLGVTLLRPIHIKLRLKEGVIESDASTIDVNRDKKLYPDTVTTKF